MRVEVEVEVEVAEQRWGEDQKRADSERRSCQDGGPSYGIGWIPVISQRTRCGLAWRKKFNQNTEKHEEIRKIQGKYKGNTR